MTPEQLPETLTALIVDDERLAVDGIRILLADFPHIRIVGSADSIKAAVRLTEKWQPDVIFLDIHLQGESGFDLFDKTRVTARVVFVTAFDRYAVRAFEINALDYLLKPVSKKRFARTMDRILKQPSLPAAAPVPDLSYSDRLLLNLNHTVKFPRVSRITCITAEGDYTRVRIHGEKSELILRTLKSWEAILPRTHFLRIHRSSIINLEFIREIQSTTSNRFLVFLKDRETPMVMSQRCAAKLRKRHFQISDVFVD